MHAERFRSLHFHFRCLFILTIYVYLCCKNEKKGLKALQARFRFKNNIFFLRNPRSQPLPLIFDFIPTATG